MTLKPLLLHKINATHHERDPVEAAAVHVFFTLQLNGTVTTGCADIFHDGTYIEAFWSSADQWLDSLTCTRLKALTWEDNTTILATLRSSITSYILGRDTCDHFQLTRTTRSSFLQAPV